MKLTPKLTLLFVFFAATLLTVLDLLAYNIGRSMLEATAGEKQASLNAWLQEKQADIKDLAEDTDTVEDTGRLKTSASKDLTPSIVHDQLVQQFELRVSAGEFLSVMVLDSESGEVLVSTNPNKHDKPRDARYFLPTGKQGAYLTPVYFSQELQAPAVTASAPVIAKDGQLVGVLVGRLDLDQLNTIIRRRSGLHQTDDAWLVNASKT